MDEIDIVRADLAIEDAADPASDIEGDGVEP